MVQGTLDDIYIIPLCFSILLKMWNHFVTTKTAADFNCVDVDSCETFAAVRIDVKFLQNWNILKELTSKIFSRNAAINDIGGVEYVAFQ